MKQIFNIFILTIFLTTGFLALNASHVFAFNPFPSSRPKICNSETSSSVVCQDPGNAPNPLTGENGVLIKSARLLSTVIGLVAVVIIMFSGWQYINSGGDPQKVNGAKNTMLYAFAGLAVAVLAQAIIAFALNHL